MKDEIEYGNIKYSRIILETIGIWNNRCWKYMQK